MTCLHINLVTAENNRDIFANTLKIAMPIRDVLVRDSRGHVEHDDTALALDVVSIAKPTKLLLSSSIPDVEDDGAEVGGERQRMNLDTECGCGFV
jgi:hypothetical protein